MSRRKNHTQIVITHTHTRSAKKIWTKQFFVRENIMKRKILEILLFLLAIDAEKNVSKREKMYFLKSFFFVCRKSVWSPQDRKKLMDN